MIDEKAAQMTVAECTICYEYHPKKDAIHTSCGHWFGQKCYDAWTKMVREPETCPNCRFMKPMVTGFVVWGGGVKVSSDPGDDD